MTEPSATPVPVEAAAAILATHYGLDGPVRSLSGEVDANFTVAVQGRTLLLKVAPAGEDPALTAMRAAALLHLAARDPGLPVPRLVRTRAGAETCAPDIAGHRRTAHLVTFLPGVLQGETAPSAAQAGALGAVLARLQEALADFAHPADRHPHVWDLRHAADLRALLPCVADTALRHRHARHLDAFAAEVAPRLAALRAQVVHNDINPGNVLVDPGEASRVTGVIDFGDLVRTQAVADLAIAATYQLRPAGPPLAGVLALLEGYVAVRPLEAEEVALLADLILARLVSRIVIPAWRASKSPHNGAYIRRNVAAALAAMDRLAAMPPADVRDALRRVADGVPGASWGTGDGRAPKWE